MKTCISSIILFFLALIAPAQTTKDADAFLKNFCREWKLSSSSQAGRTYTAGSKDEAVRFTFNADHTYYAKGMPGGDNAGVWIYKPAEKDVFLYTCTTNPTLRNSPYASDPLALRITSLEPGKLVMVPASGGAQAIVNTFVPAASGGNTPSISYKRNLDLISGSWKPASRMVPDQNNPGALIKAPSDAQDSAYRITYKPGFTCLVRELSMSNAAEEHTCLWNFDDEKSVIILVSDKNGDIEQVFSEVRCMPDTLEFEEEYSSGMGKTRLIHAD